MMSRSLPTASTHEELEMLIAKEWKVSKKVAAGIFLFSVFLFVVAWSGKVSPILDLSDMQVIEGELVKAVPQKPKKFPYLVIKKDDGSFFNVVSYSGDLKSLIGEKIKVWSEDHCVLLSYGCYQIVRQIQYKDSLLLDYEDFVRLNKKDVSEGKFDGFIFFVPAFVFLLAIGILDVTRHKVKKMRMLFKGCEGR